MLPVADGLLTLAPLDYFRRCLAPAMPLMKIDDAILLFSLLIFIISRFRHTLFAFDCFHFAIAATPRLLIFAFDTPFSSSLFSIFASIAFARHY